jgi:hypothetical protein
MEQINDIVGRNWTQNFSAQIGAHHMIMPNAHLLHYLIRPFLIFFNIFFKFKIYIFSLNFAGLE